MFHALRWRIFLSFLGVMAVVQGTSTIAVYKFSSYSLYHKIDCQLVSLASAAAHNLLASKTDRAAIYRKILTSLDDNGDLDIPRQDRGESNQSVEWFDANGQLWGRAGKHLPSRPLVAKFYIFQQGHIRSLTIPMYSPRLGETRQQLQGYVRVSESTQAVETELGFLRWRLGLVGIIALTLTGIGGLWQCFQSLKLIEQSFQKLKQFTADASHELRSPLTVMTTVVEVMQSHPERIHSADVKKLAALASATEQMTRLLEDLLLLARTDAASATPVVESISISLDEVLEDLIDSLSPQAQAKEITLKSDLPYGVFVKGNPAQLRRLFSNLLENALQYTPDGGVVTVSIVRRDRFVTVCVEDTGTGIAPEHILLLFDRFFRAEKARSQREAGLGLGLAIAQSLAHQHGGEITVSSRLGVGTCFRVRLPGV